MSPEPLIIGDTIGLVTPSSPMFPGRLEMGISYLEQKGFKVKLGNHLCDANRFLAGRDEDRAQDIMDFFLDKDVKAIMATGGGYGSQRVLPFLDYDLIRANPKITTGASDSTALQFGLLKQAGIVSYAGFVFSELDTGAPVPLIEQTLLACLKGVSYSISEGKMVYPGIAEGVLVGGNLECITALMGTPYQPDSQSSILFIEDVGAEPYQVDSRLSQLALAGVFKQVAGAIFCSFARCTANYFPARDGTVDDVINEWSSRINVPCLRDFPFGHGDRRCVLPVGKKVILNADVGMLTIL